VLLTLGGLGGADSICQEEAENSGLPGIWKAILSDSTIDARDRLVIRGPVYRLITDWKKPHLFIVADSEDDLWDGSINRNIRARFGRSSGKAFTGTDESGRVIKIGSLGPCYDWQKAGAGFRATTGWLTSQDNKWINSGITEACNKKYRLYCISVVPCESNADCGNAICQNGECVTGHLSADDVDHDTDDD